LENNSGPVNTLQPVMTINEMLAKIATAAELGNKGAQRMLSTRPKTYDFGNGYIGTHYMTSVDNYSIPALQDTGKENLEMVDVFKPTKEDFIFENEQKARYFAENYKKAPLPMLTKRYTGVLPRFQSGGAITVLYKAPITQKEQINIDKNRIEDELIGLPKINKKPTVAKDQELLVLKPKSTTEFKIDRPELVKQEKVVNKPVVRVPTKTTLTTSKNETAPSDEYIYNKLQTRIYPDGKKSIVSVPYYAINKKTKERRDIPMKPVLWVDAEGNEIIK